MTERYDKKYHFTYITFYNLQSSKKILPFCKNEKREEKCICFYFKQTKNLSYEHEKPLKATKFMSIDTI